MLWLVGARWCPVVPGLPSLPGGARFVCPVRCPVVPCGTLWCPVMPSDPGTRAAAPCKVRLGRNRPVYEYICKQITVV